MVDPLPNLINEHTWTTIIAKPGNRHRLIPIGWGNEGGKNAGMLLDWIEDTGEYFVWVADTAATATSDPYLDTPRTTGTWGSIRDGHQLIYLADEPGNWETGLILDWVAATRAVRIWQLDRNVTAGDPLPIKLNQSTFATIGVGHQLIYLDHDRVLDWEPTTGHARIWACDRSRVNQDPLPTLVTECTWATIRAGHQLAYLGGDLVLDWSTSDGNVRVWRYDRAAAGVTDPFVGLEFEDDWSGKIGASRQIRYLGGDLVLDWDPGTGNERVWDVDRPMMPATAFNNMLSADIVVALAWVVAAQGALLWYQGGVASGVHDARWNAIDAALTTHFHAQAHPAGVAAAVNEIRATYTAIGARLAVGTAAFTAVSKAQAIVDLGGRSNYVRAYTVPGSYTRLTPAYRPFDTIGFHALDGAGQKLRAAILIHEVTHFVGNNPDAAPEWDPRYATLTSQQAIKNPSSYAAFAHNVTPEGGNPMGTDLRFGLQPWL